MIFFKEFAILLIAAGLGLSLFGNDVTPFPVLESTAGWEMYRDRPAEVRLKSPEPGVLALEGDFQPGGGEVAMMYRPTPSRFYETLRFKVRTPASHIHVRLEESNGQNHQFELPLSGRDGEWQPLSLPIAGAPKGHWGGPNNGRFESELIRVWFILKRSHVGQLSKFSSAFQDIELTSRAGAPRELRFTAPEPDKMFVEPGGGATVSLLCSKRLGNVTTDELKYEFRDYEGKPVASGTGEYDASTRLFTVPAPDRIGMYDLHVPAFGFVAGVAVAPRHSGAADEYFGFDTCFSFGMHKGAEGTRSRMRLMKYIGAIWSRDRLALQKLTPAPGVFDLERIDFWNHYHEALTAAEAEGIRTLETFEATPGWNRYGGPAEEISRHIAERRPGSWSFGRCFLPWDFIKAFKGLHGIYAYWPRTLSSLEVWNEPNTSFNNDFPMAYVISLTKAMSSGFARSGRPQKIVGLSNAGAPSGNIYGLAIRNGLLEEVDAVSWHSYSSYSKAEDDLLRTRENEIALARSVERELAPDRAGIPIWMTESGSPWRKRDVWNRPAVDEDRRSAMDVAVLAAEFRALGMERYFLYCFDYYDEGRNNFGHLDGCGTPQRSLAAYATLIREIYHKEYARALPVPGAVRSRTFTDGRNTVAVLYTGLLADRCDFLQLPAGLRIRDAVGLDGRPLEVTGGRVPMADGAVFVRMDSGAAAPFLNRETRAMELYRLAKEYMRPPRKAYPVVFQPANELADAFSYSPEGCLVRTGDACKIQVMLNNFGNVPVRVAPRLKLPAGLTADKEIFPPVTVPVDGRIPLDFTLRVDKEAPPDVWQFVELSDAEGGASPLVLSYMRCPDKVSVQGHPLTSAKFDRNHVSKAQGWTEMTSWLTTTGFFCPKNIDAKFRVLNNAGKLRLEVAVKDDALHCRYSAKEAWNGDSVQFVFYPVDAGSNQAIPPRREFTAARSQDGEKAFVITTSNTGGQSGIAENTAVKLIQTGPEEYLYVIDIPASELGVKSFLPGQQWAFSILVNSNSGSGREGYLSWGGGIARNKLAKYCNLLILH